MTAPSAPRTSLVELIGAARADDDPARLAEAIPYSRFMGITMEHHDGELRGRLRYADMLIGNPALPALHGGTIGALLESTAIFQVLWEADTVVLPKTIGITVEYLRPGRPVDTWAVGVLTRQGRRVANVRIEAWQDDRARPIAIGLAHFLLVPADAGERVSP